MFARVANVAERILAGGQAFRPFAIEPGRLAMFDNGLHRGDIRPRRGRDDRIDAAHLQAERERTIGRIAAKVPATRDPVQASIL